MISGKENFAPPGTLHRCAMACCLIESILMLKFLRISKPRKNWLFDFKEKVIKRGSNDKEENELIVIPLNKDSFSSVSKIQTPVAN